MNKYSILFCVFLLQAGIAMAHVTPNVQLAQRGDFIKASLPAATKFFEHQLNLNASGLAEIRKATDWTPSADDTRIYVGRDNDSHLVGSVVFLWIPSEHGPIGIAVAFNPNGTIINAAVTDAGAEPLTWVRPLLEQGAMAAFQGLSDTQAPNPVNVAPHVQGAMSRYYAKVIAEGVSRAQALIRAMQF